MRNVTIRARFVVERFSAFFPPKSRAKALNYKLSQVRS
jgi:hypothetical protein